MSIISIFLVSVWHQVDDFILPPSDQANSGIFSFVKQIFKDIFGLFSRKLSAFESLKEFSKNKAPIIFNLYLKACNDNALVGGNMFDKMLFLFGLIHGFKECFTSRDRIKMHWEKITWQNVEVILLYRHQAGKFLRGIFGEMNAVF